MKAEDCTLLTLASGLSERFGPEDKLLALFQGRPLAGHVIGSMQTIPFGRRLAVIPAGAAERQSLFKHAGYDLVENPEPERGQGASLLLGVKAAEAETLCVMLADMPLVPTGHIHNMLELADRSDIVMSEHDGIRMPPVIFSGEALNKFDQIDRQTGGKSLFAASEGLTVKLSSLAAMDIDTQADLIELEHRLAS